MDSARPLYSTVVRFKVLHSSKSNSDAVLAGEEQARLTLLERAAEKKFSNRNYLLILTPQDFQLFATRDSDFARAGELGALGVGTSGGSASSGDSDLALPHFMRANVRLGPCSNVLGARLAGAERLMAGATRILGLDALAGGLRKAGAAGAAAIGPRRASDGGGDGCDTASDAARGTGKQGAAAASISPRHNSGDVSESESAGGADAACTSPTSMAAEELEPDSVVTLSVAFSQVREVRQVGASVVVSFLRQKPRVRMLNRAEKLLKPWERDTIDDPLLRTAVLAVQDEAAAAELAGAVQAALAQLAQAVEWVSRGLPLIDSPRPVLLTAQSGGEGTPAEVVATAPGWGQPTPLPPSWCQHVSAGGPEAAGACVTVWLSTPLGPASASIGAQQFLQAPDQKGLQLLVRAQVQPPPADGAGGGAAGSSPRCAQAQPLQVQLQAEVRRSGGESDLAARPQVQPPGDPPQPGGGSAGGQLQASVLGSLLVAVVAAWIQLFASSGPTLTGTSATLHWLAFVACNAAAAAALLPLLAAWRRAPAAAGVAASRAAPSWSLTLLHASLVSEEEGALEEVAEAGVELETEGEKGTEAAEPQLPEAFRQLVQKHSAALDANAASRFLATYPSPGKALAALEQCAEWRERQGYVGLLDQPHPKFEVVKRRYPHAVLGWSTKKDCLVTLDNYGRWKQSYDTLRADGVSDDELLRHLVYCFDYNFHVLDTRQLPQGKSVNIVDLQGLKMGDAAGPAFRFISKAGSLLNLHYPGRLHKAFLINAPSWWSIIWRLVSPLIHPDTRKLMALYSAKDKAGAREALLEWVDASILPAEYGGSSTAGLYDCPLEQQLWQHVARVNASAGGARVDTASQDNSCSG
ncbi:hypothetical protein ABPG77_006800 [Micractinium sp. CCAP 211/92]